MSIRKAPWRKVQKWVHTCSGKMANKQKLKSPENSWASGGDEGGDKKKSAVRQSYTIP
jgi:hypothetical protein